jgi:methyl coenzyme M reductase beta subunit
MTRFRDAIIRRGDHVFVRHLRFGGYVDNASATRADDAGTQKNMVERISAYSYKPYSIGAIAD